MSQYIKKNADDLDSLFLYKLNKEESWNTFWKNIK